MPFRCSTAYSLCFIFAFGGAVAPDAKAQSSSPQTSAQQATPTTKTEPQEIRTLRNLIKEKRFAEAYTLSNTLIEVWGGDPGFDLLAGQAAYGANHFQEAVFAFERVLLVNPNILLARLYLAFSYFKVKNKGAAQRELTKLLKEDLKPEDAQRVKDYLDRITELKEKSVVSHAVNVKLAYGYDSNANSGTTLDNLSNIPVDSPFFPIIGSLDESSLEQSDHTTDVALTYAYNRKLSQKRSVSFNGAYANTRFNQQEQLDREILNLTGTFTDHYWGATVNLTGFAQPMILDSEFFRAAYGVSLDAS